MCIQVAFGGWKLHSGFCIQLKLKLPHYSLNQQAAIRHVLLLGPHVCLLSGFLFLHTRKWTTLPPHPPTHKYDFPAESNLDPSMGVSVGVHAQMSHKEFSSDPPQLPEWWVQRLTRTTRNKKRIHAFLAETRWKMSHSKPDYTHFAFLALSFPQALCSAPA